MRRIKKLPAFTPFAAGATTVADVPVGLTYERLMLRHTAGLGVDATQATFATNVDEIRVILDAEVIMRLSGAQLNAINNFYGVTHEDGVFPILFSRPWARTVAGEDELAIGTADVDTFHIEVDVNAAAATPTLELYAVQSPGTPLGTHITIKPFPKTASGAGEFQIQDIPKGPFGAFAMHMDTTNINTVNIEANGKKVTQADKAILKAVNVEAGRANQTGYTHLDYVSTNRMRDALPLDLQDFVMEFDMSAAASFTLLLERAEHRTATAKAQANATV